MSYYYMVVNVENILNNEELFGNTIDTPKEGVDQHWKRECLMGAISKGKKRIY